jgi:hypothetical protein
MHFESRMDICVHAITVTDSYTFFSDTNKQTNKLCYRCVNSTIYDTCFITVTTNCTVDITANVCLLYIIHCCLLQLNFGVRSLKMLTMPKHVVVEELKDILIVKMCVCWCYRRFNVSKCKERTV